MLDVRNRKNSRLTPHAASCGLLILILLIGAFLRIYNIGDESIWLDEAVGIKNVSNSFISMINAVIHHDASPPLYFALLWTWIKAFGSSEIGVRSLSAILGIISIFLMYRLGVTLFGKREGLLSAFIFSISKPPIWASQEARMYPLFIFLVLAGTILFVKLLSGQGTRPTRLRWLFLTIINTLIVYTHIYGLFFVISESIYIVLLKRDLLKKWIISLGVICICFIPWAFVLKMQISEGVGSWIGKLAISGPYYILWKLSSEHKIMVIIFSALACLAILDTFVKKREARKEISFLLLWIFTPIILAYIISYLIRPFLDPRYLFYLLPAYYLLASRGILWFSPIRKSLSNGVQGIIIAGITGVTGYCLYSYYTLPQKSEWRESVQFIESSNLNVDAIVLTGGIEPFEYYYKGNSPIICAPFALSADAGHPFIEGIKKDLQDTESIWFLETHYHNPEFKFEQWLRENFYFKEDKSFHQIEIYYCVRK